MQAEAGKGSAPRKSQDMSAYRDNYDKIFGGNSWLERKKMVEAQKAQVASSQDENERKSIYAKD